jgi:hypothetical protein
MIDELKDKIDKYNEGQERLTSWLSARTLYQSSTIKSQHRTRHVLILFHYALEQCNDKETDTATNDGLNSLSRSRKRNSSLRHLQMMQSSSTRFLRARRQNPRRSNVSRIKESI